MNLLIIFAFIFILNSVTTTTTKSEKECSHDTISDLYLSSSTNLADSQAIYEFGDRSKRTSNVKKINRKKYQVTTTPATSSINKTLKFIISFVTIPGVRESLYKNKKKGKPLLSQRVGFIELVEFNSKIDEKDSYHRHYLVGKGRINKWSPIKIAKTEKGVWRISSTYKDKRLVLTLSVFIPCERTERYNPYAAYMELKIDKIAYSLKNAALAIKVGFFSKSTVKKMCKNVFKLGTASYFRWQKDALVVDENDETSKVAVLQGKLKKDHIRAIGNDDIKQQEKHSSAVFFFNAERPKKLIWRSELLFAKNKFLRKSDKSKSHNRRSRGRRSHSNAIGLTNIFTCIRPLTIGLLILKYIL